MKVTVEYDLDDYDKNDKMKHDLELYPFVKQNPRKTLIVPIIEKRLAEKLEQERLSQED
jgi:methylmalonyl-CoA mutase